MPPPWATSTLALGRWSLCHVGRPPERAGARTRPPRARRSGSSPRCHSHSVQRRTRFVQNNVGLAMIIICRTGALTMTSSNALADGGGLGSAGASGAGGCALDTARASRGGSLTSSPLAPTLRQQSPRNTCGTKFPKAQPKTSLTKRTRTSACQLQSDAPAESWASRLQRLLTPRRTERDQPREHVPG